MNRLASLVMLLPISLSAGSYKGSNIEKALDISANRSGVPHRLLKSICMVESKLNPKAFNKYDGGSPSYGLCQVKLKTAKWVGYRGNARGLFNPYTNAGLAGKYLRYQLDRYNGDWIKAISAYNRGSARLTKNRKYVNLVLNNTLRF